MAGHFKFRSLILLAIFTISVSGEYLIASIDCGGSDVTTDTNSITWSPDDTLVSNGVARTVQPLYAVAPVMDSLRVFTTRRKNCYSIGPNLRGVKVLVRASFNYGNYDLLSNPPQFDLHFDGNHWAMVQSTSLGVIWYEIIYVAKKDNISVCLAQTNPGQFPFISALEVRKLDPEVYGDLDKNRALYSIRRDSYGASKATRYPADKYDRIWQPPNNGMIDVLINEASFVDTTKEPNKPPVEIFQHAMTGKSTIDRLYVGTVSPSDPPVYANMYFSEVTFLGSLLTRSLRVYDSSSLESNWLSSPTSPPYGGVLKLSYYNYTVDSTTNVYITATSDSDYPPIINAFESFYISDILTDGTNSKDVAGLTLLQSTFKVLGGWSGDPCLPAPYSWDWLSCSDDDMPRVTSLHLNGFGLSGSLPDISSMDALEIIDLHNNSLTGTIPSFLGNMPNLQQFKGHVVVALQEIGAIAATFVVANKNLADNKFRGSIPTSLSKNNKVKLTVTGNPLCTSGKSCSSSPGTNTSSPDGKKKSGMLPIILGITIPVFVLIWVAAGVYIITRRKTNPANTITPVVTGVGSGANTNPGGGLNGNLEGVEMNDTKDNVVQRPSGSN